MIAGGGGLERFYGSLDEDRAIDEIQDAIRLGLNYVHTAPWYGTGKSEALLGKVRDVEFLNLFPVLLQVPCYDDRLWQPFLVTPITLPQKSGGIILMWRKCSILQRKE